MNVACWLFELFATIVLITGQPVFDKTTMWLALFVFLVCAIPVGNDLHKLIERYIVKHKHSTKEVNNGTSETKHTFNSKT